MTQSNYDTFVDRRTEEECAAGLATPILFWYDEDKKGRARTNGVAMTIDGHLMMARSTCSKKDQFVKSLGRMIVTQRILGCDVALQRRPNKGSRHSCKLFVPGVTQYPDGGDSLNDIRTLVAQVYEEQFPDDEIGRKRAYNVANIYMRYQQEIKRRADELLDGFEHGND